MSTSWGAIQLVSHDIETTTLEPRGTKQRRREKTKTKIPYGRLPDRVQTRKQSLVIVLTYNWSIKPAWLTVYTGCYEKLMPNVKESLNKQESKYPLLYSNLEYFINCISQNIIFNLLLQFIIIFLLYLITHSKIF